VNQWFQNAFDYWLGPPGDPRNPWYNGPKNPSFQKPGVEPALRPVPSEAECDEEWANARKECDEMWKDPRCFPRGVRGKTRAECEKALVSVLCGGNSLDWGPNGPFGK